MRTPELTSLARRRLILTSITFDPSGSVSSRHACSAMALRSTTEGKRRISNSRMWNSAVVRLSSLPFMVTCRRAGSNDRAPRFITGAPTPRGRRCSAHPGDELPEIEWLDQVVVGPRVQALDAVGRRVASGQHQDGGGPVVAPCPGRDLDAGDT